MARIVRHESERDVWEMVHGAPDPRLGGYVLGYCAYDERTSSFVRRRELPSERVVMIVNLGAPIRILMPGGWTDQPIGFFAGMHDTFAVSGSIRTMCLGVPRLTAHNAPSLSSAIETIMPTAPPSGRRTGCNESPERIFRPSSTQIHIRPR